jgi:prepilin-type N-terminal cleavage/methylation domain-containing protein
MTSLTRQHSLKNRFRSAGFTLVELMVVVVVLGVLVAIAIPKFSNTKTKAIDASMKSDLRNLASAEEGYYYTNSVYTTVVPNLNYLSSPGVTITIPEATAGGWSAVATSPAAGAVQCAVFFGTAAPVAPATVEGQIACG